MLIPVAVILIDLLIGAVFTLLETSVGHGMVFFNSLL